MEESDISLDSSFQPQIFEENISGDVDNLVPNSAKKKSFPVTVYRLMKREDALAAGIPLEEGSVINPNESTTVITRQTIVMDQNFPMIKEEEISGSNDDSLDDRPEEMAVASNETDSTLRYGCAVCGKRFHHMSHLRRHEKGHSGERPFLCEDCPKAFSDASTLQRHSRTHTSERAFACVTCGKRFVTASAMRRHAMLHDPSQRRHACHLCTKRFPDNAARRKHVLTHGDTRDYACQICDKRFFHVGDLNGHRKIHDLVKPHNCPHCGRQFVKYSNFSRHLLIHEGEKQFACHVCCVSYNFQSSLTRHLLTHVSRARQESESQQILILPSTDKSKCTLRSIRRLLDESQGESDASWNGQEEEFEISLADQDQQGTMEALESQEIVPLVDPETDQATDQVDVQQFFPVPESQVLGQATQDVVYEIKVFELDNGQIEVVAGI